MTIPSSGPLVGIRVLDLGTMVAGPVAATMLADFGAEVIKIEQPKGGDTIRNNGPKVDGEGLWWNVEGRNKSSVTLDLRKPEGQQILRDLCRHADVLVENFRPGTMARWGIDYPVLRAVNPRLIMLSVSGYGQTGPYAERAAYDRIGLAFAGFLHVTGYPDRPPVRPGVAVADYQSAIMGAFSVMMALYHRDTRDGSGQQIDLSLFETIFRTMDVVIPAYDRLGVDRGRGGNLHFAAAPGDHFETSDGRFLVLTVSSNGLFERLCRAMDRPDLAASPAYATHPQRWARVSELNALTGDWIKSRPVAEITACLDAHGLAYSMVMSPSDILQDPHFAAREAIATVEHPRIGPIRMSAAHPKMSATPAPPLRAAPQLGADTDEVLARLLGLEPGDLAALRQADVI